MLTAASEGTSDDFVEGAIECVEGLEVKGWWASHIECSACSIPTATYNMDKAMSE